MKVSEAVSFRDILKQWLTMRGWSVYKLASESDLPYSTVSNILKRGTEPTYTIILKIAKGLGVSLSELFSFVESNKNYFSKDVIPIVELYTSLSKTDKRIAKAYLEGINHKSEEVL